MKFILLIIIIFIFVPFPIKIILKYKMDTKLEIFFYNIKLNSNKKHKKGQLKRDSKTKNIYYGLKNGKLKPAIRLDINFIYDLEDAATVALVYGFIWSLSTFVYETLCLLFKIKKFNYNIMPQFSNNININLHINCIFFVSLAKVIYIGFNIVKETRKLKKTKLSKA